MSKGQRKLKKIKQAERKAKKEARQERLKNNDHWVRSKPNSHLDIGKIMATRISTKLGLPYNQVTENYIHLNGESIHYHIINENKIGLGRNYGPQAEIKPYDLELDINSPDFSQKTLLNHMKKEKDKPRQSLRVGVVDLNWE